MRGAPKIDPTFGNVASDTPGGAATPAPNSPDLFGVSPASNTQTPDAASVNTDPQSQNVDRSSSSSTSTSGVTRSKPRRHSVISPGIESSRHSGEADNTDVNCNNIDKAVVRRKSTSSPGNSAGLFVVTGDNANNNNNNSIDDKDDIKELGFKPESQKRRPDRVSTSSADSATTNMDKNASRTKRVWKALSVASEGISKEKQKVMGFFRNRLRSKRGRKETSVKEIHIDPEIFDEKWASRATSSNSNCSRASSGSLKFSNGSHSSSSRESTTLHVVHDMDEEYNPEYR